ncbi:DUF2894 domain-containing protein [Noviherbaspirillum sp. ST9]|uniref:DUF2894 domain-containing protein n=1 Tax=Noviherbaspirillum sp. ST9 TaxID=3401606 RepID=UPI003B5867B8
MEIEGGAMDAAPDFMTQIASLRAAGGERFDPVRLHYLDVLARRSMAHEGSVKRMLDAKLEKALAAFQERFHAAQSPAREALDHSVQQYPDAARELQQLFAAGDFNALQRCIADLKSREQCASLGALVRRLDQHSSESTDARPAAQSGSRTELKAIRNFRNTWAKLSVDKQVAQALQQAPKNAGPINSHMLVLRSLTLMRDISPDYLGRFMTYADTLLSLDRCEMEKPAPPKKQPTAKSSKK